MEAEWEGKKEGASQGTRSDEIENRAPQGHGGKAPASMEHAQARSARFRPCRRPGAGRLARCECTCALTSVWAVGLLFGKNTALRVDVICTKM